LFGLRNNRYVVTVESRLKKNSVTVYGRFFGIAMYEKTSADKVATNSTAPYGVFARNVIAIDNGKIINQRFWCVSTANKNISMATSIQIWLRVFDVLDTKKNRRWSGNDSVAKTTSTAMLDANVDDVSRKTIAHTKHEIPKNAISGTT
jgi:hypothetical protein